MTEWVTIKVPAETRDKARDDPRTYEEILQDGLGVERDGWQPSDGAGYIPTEERSDCPDVEVDEQAIANAVTSDLLASLPSKVADEMEGRMR